LNLTGNINAHIPKPIMFGILLFILIFFPLFFQIVWGRKAIAASIKLKFWAICGISLMLQVLFSMIAFAILSDDFQQGLLQNGNRCGMALVGIIVISLFFTFLLLVAMLVQFFIKRSYER